MSLQAFPARSTTPEVEEHLIRIQGAGAADPVNETARGVTVTHVATGQYRITWAEDPGAYVGATYGLEAATPGDAAGHTLIFDTYASNVLDFIVYDAADAADDLEANEYATLRVAFKRTGV